MVGAAPGCAAPGCLPTSLLLVLLLADILVTAVLRSTICACAIGVFVLVACCSVTACPGKAWAIQPPLSRWDPDSPQASPLLLASAARSVVIGLVSGASLLDDDSSGPAVAVLLVISLMLSLGAVAAPTASRNGSIGPREIAGCIHAAWMFASTAALAGTDIHLGRWVGLETLLLLAAAQVTQQQRQNDAALDYAAPVLLGIGLFVGLLYACTAAALLGATACYLLLGLIRVAAAAAAAAVAADTSAWKRRGQTLVLTMQSVPGLVLAAATDHVPGGRPVARRVVLALQAVAAVAAAAVAGDGARTSGLGAGLTLLGLLDTVVCYTLHSRGVTAAHAAQEPARTAEVHTISSAGEASPKMVELAASPATSAPSLPTPASASTAAQGGQAAFRRAGRACGACCCCVGARHRRGRACCACCAATSYAAAAALVLCASVATHDPLGAAWMARHAPFYGVNLGGWLLTERWLNDARGVQLTQCCGEVDSPFVNSSWDEVYDEHTLSTWLRARGAEERLVRFRDTFVTRADFEAMAARGIRSARLPFGYWVASEEYVTMDGARASYVHGEGLRRLDDAVRWAEETNCSLILDLHGAPGSQNGKQTSGLEDGTWTADRFNASAAVEVVRTVASRYANSSAVVGLEVLNEPELPAELLLDYYQRAYRAVREAGMDAGRVAVVINLFRLQHILTEAWAQFNWFMPAHEYPNIVYDLHIYYAFAPEQFTQLPSRPSRPAKKADLRDLVTTGVDLQTVAMELTGRPAFVGEWSLALPGWIIGEVRAMSADERTTMRREFMERQARRITMGNRGGGFFWTWNSRSPAWGFSDLEANGLLERSWWSSSVY